MRVVKALKNLKLLLGQLCVSLASNLCLFYSFDCHWSLSLDVNALNNGSE